MSITKHVHLLQNKFDCDKIYNYDGAVLYYWKDREYFILSIQNNKAIKRPIAEIDKALKQLKPKLIETFNFN